MFVSKKKYDALAKDHRECLKIARRLAEINNETLTELRDIATRADMARNTLITALEDETSDDLSTRHIFAMVEAIGYLTIAQKGE